MKKRNLLVFILLGAMSVSFLATTTFSCSGKKDENKDLFTIDTANLKFQYEPQESITLSVVNPNNETIESVDYFVNDQKIGSIKGNEKFTYALQGKKLGYQNIKAVVHYDGEVSETEARVELVSNVQPKLLEYTIVNTYPHDMTSYTQGLEFYRDTLIEGTGRYGVSTLRKTDYKTGKVYNQISLDGKYFGEGITVLNNKIYQLTWKENTGFVYNADNLKKEKDFTYFKNVEGWGLTNDGKNLYQSDGTEKIWVLDPTSLKEADYINVYTKNSKIKAVNELEWIDGKIYGNIYQKDAIAVIDPKTGAVEAVLNLAELKTKVTQHPDLDVLNGIAYNPKTKTIFVTGKNWDKMFEIKIK
jgi:glutamine cyclotransferase